MKWWNVRSGREDDIDIYKIYSDGRLQWNWKEFVYLKMGEVEAALSLEGGASYQKLKELFET